MGNMYQVDAKLGLGDQSINMTGLKISTDTCALDAVLRFGKVMTEKVLGKNTFNFIPGS